MYCHPAAETAAAVLLGGLAAVDLIARSALTASNAVGGAALAERLLGGDCSGPGSGHWSLVRAVVLCSSLRGTLGVVRSGPGKRCLLLCAEAEVNSWCLLA